jgi:ribosomal protein S18 acetylase RimI-like enzyme
MSVSGAGHALDNPVWSSMRGTHGELAQLAQAGSGSAGRYRRDVCPFGAVEDPRNPECWDALAAVVDGPSVCVLVDAAAVPGGWEVIATIPGVQMDGTAFEPADDHEAVTLTDTDVAEMLALVEQTRPGPFLPRTIEMGRYIGIRRGSKLVAMAGERLRPSGWTEISAVCTDEAHRGQGLGTRLVRAVAAGVRAREERPFLHAAATNTNAIRLYQKLGFTVRATPMFTIVSPPAPSP